MMIRRPDDKKPADKKGDDADDKKLKRSWPTRRATTLTTRKLKEAGRQEAGDDADPR